MPNSAKYQEKMKRINDAISLTEGDVPMIPIVQCYPYIHAGYTMADILYDTDCVKAQDSLLKYLDEYDPDALMGHAYVDIGQGPILELVKPKTIRWAGMPGNIIDKNSIHQFIEFPVLALVRGRGACMSGRVSKQLCNLLLFGKFQKTGFIFSEMW